MGYYLGRIFFWDEDKEKMVNDYCIIAAGSYTEAVEKLVFHYGEDIDNMEITYVNDYSCFEVNESFYNEQKKKIEEDY